MFSDKFDNLIVENTIHIACSATENILVPRLSVQ